MYKIPILLSCLLFLISGCSYKGVPYFQDLNNTSPVKETIGNYQELTVQPEDIIGISVSSLNSEASSVFNYNLNTITGTSQISPNNPIVGYLVDEKGAIQLPLIGNLKVSGLTLSSIRETIQSRLNEYLKQPVVNIRLINFKVSVMGDVLRPGVYPVQNQRISIAEALTMAGDLNITALRNNVVLIRESGGNREYIRIDLTSKKLFNSPYYYLKTNDILYVQPGRNKFASVDNSYRNIGILISALSIVAILLTR
ncbi:Polysaccharide export outer membrane protein [Arcticibacter svalbardensis MN12-7]|uniref:Polysaccharide export outer membrane protein n=1 Tax=Arcticibacter svalbardensis MN12-7 TaxID=1150600 RepID=R9GRT8_9SPHI|nr:polysaccharide biosynthesis/export family protein [Arcticibacter svalbardensis]EOR94562.1 Polysaccharide export outer membrane protein [Arcticibacter svalbardensis MN12-7]